MPTVDPLCKKCRTPLEPQQLYVLDRHKNREFLRAFLVCPNGHRPPDIQEPDQRIYREAR